MNTIIFSVILLVSMMALVGGIATQWIVVSEEEAFTKGSACTYECGHDSQVYESSIGKYHHNEDDAD